MFPFDNPYLAPFEAAVRDLNPLVAVKLRSAAVHSALALVLVLYTLPLLVDISYAFDSGQRMLLRYTWILIHESKFWIPSVT